MNLLWIILANTFDAYDIRQVAQFPRAATLVLKIGLLTAALSALLLPLFLPYTLPLGQLLIPLLATPLLLILFRGIYNLVFSRTVSHRRVLIIGAGWAGSTIAAELTPLAELGVHIAGFIDDDPRLLGRHILPGLPVLGNRHALRTLIQQHQVTTLVTAITHNNNGELLWLLMDSLELGVEIISMAVLYEQLTGKIPVEHIGSNWHVSMPTVHPGTRQVRRLVNRIFDILAASLGMLCLAPLAPFLALAIYLDSPGPIFYTQERVGKGGRSFRVYKFRSMIPEAERDGAVWAQKDDDRVTRVGKFLRKTHVDEFPQFLNILKGEMSAVGPRPERPEFVNELAADIPFYRVRHAVKPGMAGWGLVKQGYGSSVEDALIKLQYDLYYIKHQSLWLDVLILLKTIKDTLTLGGR